MLRATRPYPLQRLNAGCLPAMPRVVLSQRQTEPCSAWDATEALIRLAGRGKRPTPVDDGLSVPATARPRARRGPEVREPALAPASRRAAQRDASETSTEVRRPRP